MFHWPKTAATTTCDVELLYIEHIDSFSQYSSFLLHTCTNSKLSRQSIRATNIFSSSFTENAVPISPTPSAHLFLGQQSFWVRNVIHPSISVGWNDFLWQTENHWVAQNGDGSVLSCRVLPLVLGFFAWLWTNTSEFKPRFGMVKLTWKQPDFYKWDLTMTNLHLNRIFREHRGLK